MSPHWTSKEALEAVVIYTSLGWIWGLVHYLDQVRKGERFKFWLLAINIIISAWIWWVMWPLLPHDLTDTTKFSIISVSWFLSYIILKFIEDRWLQLLLKKLWIKI